MKIAVIGSRNSRNLKASDILRHIPMDCSLLITGGADGVDALASQAAGIRHIPVRCIAPDYQAFGKSAPLVRNKKIVEQADFVLAFWDFNSRGTASAIAACVEQNRPFQIIGLDEFD